MTLLAPAITTEQFLDMPDKPGVEQFLVDGQLKERRMTRRSFDHGEVQANLMYVLVSWQKASGRSDIGISGGEAAVRVKKDPDTTFGVDVVVADKSLLGRSPGGSTFVDGVPLLIAEVLSPSDRQKDIWRKIDAYLEAGVPLIWVADSAFSIITEHRPDQPPRAFNITQEISGEPHLPGFRVKVSDIFAK